MFKDRTEAGSLLAARLTPYEGRVDSIVAIPRGGVVVGFEISKELHVPLNTLVIKKIPSPYQPELAIGAIGPEGFTLGIKDKKTEKAVTERIRLYSQELNFLNKRVILTDDGVATGATIETAISYLKKKGVRKIIVAVPVVVKEEYEKLLKMVDGVISLTVPESFGAIGEFYRNFEQVDDRDVIQLLER